MSPQFRATTKNTTSTLAYGDGKPCNSCSVAVSVAALAKAAETSFFLHKIESESGADESWTPANPRFSQDSTYLQATSARKRSCTQISSEDPKEPPSLSSYGSAFLSGIFADIAQASDEIGASSSDEPHSKKIRTMNAPLTRGRHSKSYKALAGLTAGTDSEAIMPSVVSPRFNQSTTNIDHFKDRVRELQGMAFPSLPHFPNTISTSSFSSSMLTPLTRGESSCSIATEFLEQDSPSEYGWFVSTDDDDAISALVKERVMSVSSAPAFDDLAFKVRAASLTEDTSQDSEVQQALAADTIDDVLGDFF